MAANALRREVNRMKLYQLLILLASLGSGCGALNVDRLSLGDPRLPVDARRWVADAEDAVVVARARRNAAQAELDDAQRWQTKVMSMSGFKGAEGSTIQLKRDKMALARVDALTLGVDLTTAEFELSKARLKLIYAETAMRNDISVYNMPPLQTLVAQRLQTVIAFREQHRTAREQALREADAWWTAWKNYSAKKNDTRPFWTVGQ
jgi:hypothetical protein